MKLYKSGILLQIEAKRPAVAHLTFCASQTHVAEALLFRQHLVLTGIMTIKIILLKYIFRLCSRFVNPKRCFREFGVVRKRTTPGARVPIDAQRGSFHRNSGSRGHTQKSQVIKNNKNTMPWKNSRRLCITSPIVWIFDFHYISNIFKCNVDIIIIQII